MDEGIDWYWTQILDWSECLTCEYSSGLERMRCNFAGKLVEPFLPLGSLSKGNRE